MNNSRKLGQNFFFLSREAGKMFWGGEYQREMDPVHQKRAILMNSQLVSRSSMASPSAGGLPSNMALDFRLIAGAALRSK